MSLTLYFAFILYAFVTSITPGPNNLLALSSGVNFGIKRTVPLVIGICFGFSMMFVVVALGMNQLFIRYPSIVPVLKIMGSLYILYLAYLIAGAGNMGNNPTAGQGPLGFWKGAFFQWINPKAWIVLIGAVTAYTNDMTTNIEIWLIGLLYGAVGIPCVMLWAVIGGKLSEFLTPANRMKIFNRSMGILLALSLIPILMIK